MGGGNLRQPDVVAFAVGLSPRGRGKRERLPLDVGKTRSIPAWAGETATRPFTEQRQRVYPRVGGGNSAQMNTSNALKGLSPRGRGKHRISSRYIPLARSIPAWAGETIG